MRPGPNGRRPRGRPNRKQHGGPSRPNSFDSSGPEGRIRGNAHQVYEKYIGMARDAISGGDRVAAETYYQHAEHYYRITNSSTDPEQPERRQPRHDGNARPQAAPATGNAGPAPAPDNAAEDREGLDRALRLDGSAAGSPQPQVDQGEGQPREGQSPDQTQGRRRARPRPPRDADSAGGDERRERRPRHGNGQRQAEAAQTGDGPDASAKPGAPGAPGAETPQDKAVNGDGGAADETATGNEPITA